jgi:hypothetical protein
LEASFLDFDKAGKAGIRDAIKENTKVSYQRPSNEIVLTSNRKDHLDRVTYEPNVDPPANNTHF